MTGKKVVVVTLSVMLSMSAAAQPVSREQYTASSERIWKIFEAESGACGFFIDNAREICRVEAVGRRKVAQAGLDVQFKQSADARYQLQSAIIEADYAVSRQRCVDKIGREHAACGDEAKSQAIAASRSEVQEQSRRSREIGVATKRRMPTAAGALSGGLPRACRIHRLPALASDGLPNRFVVG